MFMQGHAQFDGQVAQIRVPQSLSRSTDYNALPIADVLQPFADVTDGELNRQPNSLGTYVNGAPIFGLLSYNGRLIVAASQYYNQIQLASHGVSSLDLSQRTDFRGFFPFASGVAAPPRALGGAMDIVPPEWRTAMGGPVGTGNQTIPVTSTNSAGPAITFFNPDNVGVVNPIPGVTLLYYPISNPLCGTPGCENTDNPVYNLTSLMAGRAFVPGTRSILVIGSHGVGGYWYGSRDGPNGQRDPFFQTTGPHSTAYRYRIWAYDANDLLAVRNGQRRTFDPRPYAIWDLPEVSQVDPSGAIAGATFEPTTRRIYITVNQGTNPRVDVYQVNVP